MATIDNGNSGRLGRGLTRRNFGRGAAAVGGLLAAGLPLGARAQGLPPLKVGVLLPRSGYLAQIGQANQRGADVAIPILRELGYPAIEMVAGDTESSPDVARAAAERLIDSGVHVVVGAFDSGQTSAIAQVCEQRGVPLVINLAAAPQITEQGYKFVFRNFPRSPRIVGDAFALQKQLFTTTGKAPKSCVLMHVNDTFGTSVKGAIEAMTPAQNMPYRIVESIAYDPRARDLSVEVAKAKATGAEIVWTVSRLNDAIMITREMVKQRWEPWGILSSGPGYYEDQYMKTLGKLGEYPISFVPWYDPQKPLTKRMLAEYKRMFPDFSADTNTVFTLEALLICADAYKRAGGARPQALTEALRATNIKDNAAVGDGISFDAKGQNETVGNAAIQNVGGQPRVVLPAKAADAKPIFPVPGWQQRG
ncbi:MAG: ABC transporter substrate-binding protein [Rhodospirillales bacterium]|nr:ABC transporter substrate-binding protein [Rhodospirillales bacterium]